jgi:hypothetical protein
LLPEEALHKSDRTAAEAEETGIWLFVK